MNEKCIKNRCPWFLEILILEDLNNMFLFKDGSACTLQHDFCPGRRIS